MTTLEDRFVAVLDELDLPDAHLVDAVLADIADHRVAPARATGMRPAWAFAVAVVILTAIVLLVEPARRTVADWLGIGATRIEVVPPGETPAEPAPRSVESLGVPAEAAVDPIPLLGPPTAVFDGGAARARSYTWAADGAHPSLGDSGIGVVLTARSTAGDIDVKRVAGDAGVEIVTVEFGGAEVLALWIDAGHELVAAGSEQPVRAERVLLWEDRGVQFRLEADVGLAAARRLAAGIEGGTDLLQPE